MLDDFIKMTNLYAFDIANDEFSLQNPYVQLNPSGTGRGCLIHLIAENKLHEKDSIPQKHTEKLCFATGR